jgi:hypothetical protein
MQLLFARGRGLGRLLEGLWEGDSTAWIILGSTIAALVGWGMFKTWAGMDDE